jgi:hypothetical protein
MEFDASEIDPLLKGMIIKDPNHQREIGEKQKFEVLDELVATRKSLDV